MTLRGRRILLIAGIATVVLVSYAWLFGFQTAMILETRWMTRKSPAIKLVPVDLGDNSVCAAAAGTKLSYFGYEFEVPWSDLDTTQTKLYPNFVALKFRTGKSLIFSTSAPRQFVNTVISSANEDTLRQLYGDAPLQSDYAMHRLILFATPQQLTLLTPRKKLIGTSILLTMKAAAVGEEFAIYKIQGSGFQGFQYGNPQDRPRRVIAELFADNGGLGFTFGGQGQGYLLGISQPEINCVLQTVHKTTQAPASNRTLAQRR